DLGNVWSVRTTGRLGLEHAHRLVVRDLGLGLGPALTTGPQLGAVLEHVVQVLQAADTTWRVPALHADPVLLLLLVVTRDGGVLDGGGLARDQLEVEPVAVAAVAVAAEVGTGHADAVRVAGHVGLPVRRR